MHKCQLSVKLSTLNRKTLQIHFTISYLIPISAVKHQAAMLINRSLRCIDMLWPMFGILNKCIAEDLQATSTY